MRTPTCRLLAAALAAATLGACTGEQAPTSEPVSTEPATTIDGEVDLASAEARAEDLLGRSEVEVVDLRDVRVVRREGEGLPLRGDLVPGRMNVTIEDGVVVDAADDAPLAELRTRAVEALGHVDVVAITVEPSAVAWMHGKDQRRGWHGGLRRRPDHRRRATVQL